jgi:cytochrome c oxidase subunit II
MSTPADSAFRGSGLTAPRRNYIEGLGRDERVWVSFAAVWCVFLFFSMYGWQAIGDQKTPIESYRVDVAEFRALTEAYLAEHTVGTLSGYRVAVPNAAGEAYVAARAFSFEPVLQLKKGETTRLYVSSYDFQHGLSIQPLNLNFQVLPGYVYVITLTPTTTGEFGLVCNEYCGLGHHAMTGRIIVTD